MKNQWQFHQYSLNLRQVFGVCAVGSNVSCLQEHLLPKKRNSENTLQLSLFTYFELGTGHYPEQTLHNISSSTSLVICRTTVPKPLPKLFLHVVRSRVSSFKWPNPVLSFRSSSSFLRLLPCLLLISVCPFIIPSITCFEGSFYVRCDQIG